MRLAENPPANRLLLALPQSNLKRLMPELEQIPCQEGRVLLDADSSHRARAEASSSGPGRVDFYFSFAYAVLYPTSPGRAALHERSPVAQVPGLFACPAGRARFSRKLVLMEESKTNAEPAFGNRSEGRAEPSVTFSRSLSSPATQANNLTLGETPMKHLFASAALAMLLAGGLAAGPTLAAQPATQLITTLPGEALPISNFYNQNVYDNRDNKIGEVNDLLLDSGGKVNAVMVGVGGFLGVGEKNVAVPFQALKVTEKDGKRYLVLDTTKEALQTAPGYTYDRSKNVWLPATKQG
jgi:sporulation protein YlmC with PRC-barrel domain